MKKLNINTIHAIPIMIVINSIETVNALLVRVNADLIMYWIRKQKFIVKLLKYRVIVSLIVVIINSVLMVCVNVNQAINKLKIRVTVNPVILTAIAINSIAIRFVVPITECATAVKLTIK